MCGIFFSLARGHHILPSPKTQELLDRRGPDDSHARTLVIPTADPQDSSASLNATFASTVLSLRGKGLVSQPLLDEVSGSVLCWNGEAWKIGREAVDGNDSQAVFRLLLNASSSCPPSSGVIEVQQSIVHAVSSITGPFAFVFYDASHGVIFYGRDCLGRRSLLRKIASNGQLIVSSVCDNDTGDQWAEIEADGVYMVSLRSVEGTQALRVQHIPHVRKGDQISGPALLLPFPSMNKAVAEEGMPVLGLESAFVEQLESVLRASLELRIRHVRESLQLDAEGTSGDARIAVLFSGGLDCTVLARLSHEILPLNESVDLLNVAFQNPRIHSKLEETVSPYELCPDRVTGRAAFAELQAVCPGRVWRFVEVNVPYSETVAHRANVIRLMHPHNTEMDLSISYALYFASRGSGSVRDDTGNLKTFSTAAHVLLSGLGADELFGGYGRHSVAFSRRGYVGLIEELELDFNRIGKRNLGRDDRVISDSGKEVRFPYLDEDLIAWALDCPVWGKCPFGETVNGSTDPALSLEPGKKVLRVLAWKLGMTGVAAEKKRAIQFGARTAKMETGRSKGTQVLS